jgi:UDP-glucose 4-epimerase
MKKILITGSSGYIGQHLCKMLKGKYHITGVDRCMRKVPKMPEWDNIFKLGKLETHFDAVVHLAADVSVGESIQYPSKYYDNNITGTHRVLMDVNCKNFIFASTGAAEYPNSSPYARSKLCAEDIVKEYCTKLDKNFTIFRFYNVIGSDGIEPTNRDGLMMALSKARRTGAFTLYGNDYIESEDGTPLRDYIYVNDVCSAIRLAIEKPTNDTEELGTGSAMSVLDMIEMYKKMNGCDFGVAVVKRRAGDLPVSYCKNISPLFKKTVTIEELLKER